MTNLPDDQHITYQLQYRKCGKPSCSTCRGTRGHGPYWYAYWREGPRLRSGYVGKVHPYEEAKAMAVAQLCEDLLAADAPLEVTATSMPQVRGVGRTSRIETGPRASTSLKEPATILM
jgi:hypothetical protein